MWQTRTLATFIAATVPTESETNPLIEAAERIGIEDDGSLGEAPTSEPPIGSYEQLVSIFGNPKAWRSN